MREWLRKILFLPVQGSTISIEVDWLHYFVILVTMGGATLVTLIGGYFLFKYRRRPGDMLRPHAHAEVRPALALEAAAILALIVMFLGWWYIGARQFARMRVAPAGAMEIYVTGKQWMWKFAYPNGNHTISTLYVPAGRPVKLIMTSRDVIHSFYVPEFRIKQDVLPGRYTTVWFEVRAPGKYQIFCTEYCGMAHSTMRGEVVALSELDYQRWLGASPEIDRVAGPQYIPPAVPWEAAPPELIGMAREGRRVAAEQGCLRCHSTDGSPHIGPTFAGSYGSTVQLERGGEAIIDEAYITESMMDPTVKLHHGYQPLMPSYMGRILPGETAAIIEYIKSLRAVRPEPEGHSAGAGAPLPPPPSGPEQPHEAGRPSPAAPPEKKAP